MLSWPTSLLACPIFRWLLPVTQVFSIVLDQSSTVIASRCFVCRSMRLDYILTTFQKQRKIRATNWHISSTSSTQLRVCQAEEASKASPKELDNYLVGKAKAVIDHALKAEMPWDAMKCVARWRLSTVLCWVLPQEPGEMSPEDLDIMRCSLWLSEQFGFQKNTAGMQTSSLQWIT